MSLHPNGLVLNVDAEKQDLLTPVSGSSCSSSEKSDSVTNIMKGQQLAQEDKQVKGLGLLGYFELFKTPNLRYKMVNLHTLNMILIIH